MKKRALMSIVLLAFVTAGAVFAQSPTLDGSWRHPAGDLIITISGNTAVYSYFNYPSGLFKSAVDKGYIKVGGQHFRNLRSTGNLTWSGQQFQIRYNTRTNEATGTTWGNITLTMDPDGITFTENNGTKWTKITLDGTWRHPAGDLIITISGDTAVYSYFNYPSGLFKSAVDKGYIKVGGQHFRNLRSTGNLTWSGQQFQIRYNTRTNEATGTTWGNITLTMDPDGITFTENDGTKWIRAGIQ